MKNPRVIASMLGLVLLLGAGTAQGANCPLRFRVWEGGGDAWFEPGEIVQVSATEPRPRLGVYLNVGRHNVVAEAEWGFPRDFGFKSVRAAEVAEHLRFVRQNDRDIEAGRLRFTTEAPGETRLGYRIVGVAEPGSLTQLPEACLVGEVRIEVVAEEAEGALDDDRLIELCQQALRDKLAGLSATDLDFKTAEIELSAESGPAAGSDPVAGPEAIIAGTADLIAAGRRSPLAYQCRVDRTSGEILDAEYRAP